MKKHLIKFISVVLIFILSAFTLSSCGLMYRTRFFKYPDGYTAGFGYNHPMDSTEYAWVETYEEVEEAIELLSSHGSNFYKTAFFNYEGDLFDTKYCFKFQGKKDNIKYGENPFDRYAEKVYIYSYAFFEDVTIDELVFSHLIDYDVAYLNPDGGFYRYCQTDNTIKSLPRESLTHDWKEYSYSFPVHYDDVFIFSVRREKWNTELHKFEETEISYKCVEAILGSVKVFGEKY